MPRIKLFQWTQPLSNEISAHQPSPTLLFILTTVKAIQHNTATKWQPNTKIFQIRHIPVSEPVCYTGT